MLSVVKILSNKRYVRLGRPFIIVVVFAVDVAGTILGGVASGSLGMTK